MVGSLALLFAIAYGLTRFAVWAKRRLLWRVRRKLILSYVFVGVVPALLVITFFLLAGLILAFNVSSYLVQSRVQEPDRPGALPRADGAARSAARGAARRRSPKRSSAGSRAPRRAIRSCRSRSCRCRTCRARSSRRKPRACRRRCRRRLPVTAGGWGHLPPPTALPKWIGCDGFSGLIAYNAPPKRGRRRGEPPQTRLVMRAVALPEVPNPTWAVVLDMPLSTTIEQRIQQETGIRMGEITALPAARRAADRRAARSRSVPPTDDDGPTLSLQPGAMGGVPRSRRLGHAASRRARRSAS